MDTKANENSKRHYGGNKVRAFVLIFLALVVLICSIVILSMRNKTQGTTTIDFGYVDGSGSFHASSSESFGGGYYFNEEGRQLLLYMFLGGLVGIALLIDMAIGFLRCSLDVYDDHIEGMAFSLGFGKRRFYILYPALNSAEQISGGIVLNSGGQRLRVFCTDAKKAFSDINTSKRECIS